MYKICVFAGTTEGRQMVEFLLGQPAAVTACVATEYGETLLPEAENLTVCAGRLDEAQMEALFRREQFGLVIDATHPYASAVTENLAAACAVTGTEYLRLLREDAAAPADAVFVESIGEAVEVLNRSDEKILLTTGSKELAKFAPLRGFADRVYARVLPMEESLRLCAAAGLKPAHILAMQGPFSAEFNVAMLRSVGAKYMVTKESGTKGGFDSKIEAARQAGAVLVVIGRPPQVAGKSFAETTAWLEQRFGFRRTPRVSVVGIGPGSRELLTAEARRAIAGADCLIGGKRMLEAVADGGIPTFEAISPGPISDLIHKNRQYSHFTVLMSGDVGFFSGTKKLLPLLSDCALTVCPGISSMAYLCAKLGTSYDDVLPVSLHGRSHDLCADLRTHRRVFVLVGGENGMGKLCERLCAGGFADARVSAGERLGYPDEKITVGTARALAGQTFHSLSAALVETDGPETVVTHGLPDGLFQRGGSDEGVVPMTKSEVRSVCLSKLQLHADSVCWDVGAGTGSVAIEMALQAGAGQVWAIEKKEAALALLAENRQKFCVENLQIVAGTAPDALAELPAPTHVFVGGSSGNLARILEAALRKNPAVRIVATAIALETVAGLQQLRGRFAQSEAVSLTVAKDRRAGPYHLMTGQNPVWIFTMQGGNER